MTWWPFSLHEKTETRESGGDFSDSVLRLIETQAAGTAADASRTAAVEAASGALSRAFAGAEVQGPGWVKDAVTPEMLAQVGRDLVWPGRSMHIIDMRMGQVSLLPVSSWHFEDPHDPHPDSWTVRATYYGPSSSVTKHVPFAAVVFVKWGSTPGQRYVGTGPLTWASSTARLMSQNEKSLADEMSGPIAQVAVVPGQTARAGADGQEVDPLALLRADITKARGKALTLENLSKATGDNARSNSREWGFDRLGPAPPEVMEKIREGAFRATLAACGVPPSLFISDDGTAQREAVRRWHQNVVIPMAKLLEHELTTKLETKVKLKFDTYALDMVSRAQVVDKLVKAGVPTATALMAVGLDDIPEG